ncbi:cyclic nucleotide-binding domain-containing protein [Chloroflexota bacterium]
MVSSEITEGLSSCELFTLLGEEEIKMLIKSLATDCEFKIYKAGDNIFEQGEHSTKVYVIADGQALLQRSVNLGDRTGIRPLGLLGKGRVMGWSSLLYGPHYLTATASCQKPTQVISIEGYSLRYILEQQTQVGYKVMNRLAFMLGERLRMAYNTMEAHL